MSHVHSTFADSRLPTFISLARRGVVETNPNQTFETAG